MSQFKDLFENKKVVVFGLPGAFTPTCSASHLPGYEELYDEIKKCGVDEVYCISAVSYTHLTLPTTPYV